VNSACVHHCGKEVNHLFCYFIFCKVAYSTCFQSEILFCFFKDSIGWLNNYLLYLNIGLFTRKWFRRFLLFNSFFLLFRCFFIIFLSTFFGIFCLFFLSLFFFLFFLLNPIKFSLSNESPNSHRIIPIMELFSCLLDLNRLTNDRKIFM
jgi:hypothetical protein